MAPVPVYVKGGVWTNLEDQIVKAAIQKYGTHQWSKIASLLQKKSAKQCEIRWSEYLNPKLNFTEFSKEEDGKLLDLARKLPNQWRTIADSMGRTAQVCIDRYNNLLEGDDKDPELNLGSSIEFKVGDLNPKSETLIAKPDDIELADDEREMLAEARARLLNTQGKKATRKIRERMLEESKRIAQLQKRRELKQAGVKTVIGPSKKRYATEIDYNADVVYEQVPPSGIYDTSKEDQRRVKDFQNFQNRVEGKGLRDKTHPTKRRHVENLSNKNKSTNESTIKSREDNILTNDYKKPILSLPEPGSQSVINTDSIEGKRRKIIENRLTGAVFKKETDDRFERAISSQSEGPFEERRIPQQPTKLPSPKLLKDLFASLPIPKNDFDIIVDEEPEDVAGKSRNYDKEIETDVSLKEREDSTQVDQTSKTAPIHIDCLKSDLVSYPPFAENPKDSFDQTFNELIACSMLNEPYVQNIDFPQYLNIVEEEIKKENPEAAQELPEIMLPSSSELMYSIKQRLATIKESQKELQYLKPIIQRNDEIARELCGDQLPRMRILQQRYYVNYKMYHNETQGISKRRKRLQSNIDS